MRSARARGAWRPTAARWPRRKGRPRPPGSADRAGACCATSSAACARTGTSWRSCCRCWRRISARGWSAGRLERLRALGHIDATPTIAQLLVAGRDQMMVSAAEETKLFYRSQGIPWVFHNLRRFISGPATMLDPIGLFAPRDTIVAPRAADLPPPPALRPGAAARARRRRRGDGGAGAADPRRHAPAPARAGVADRGRRVPRAPAARHRGVPGRPARAGAPDPRRPGRATPT